MTNLLQSKTKAQAIAKSTLKHLLQTSWQNNHNRLVALGLITIGVAYLPLRLWEILTKSIQGSSILLVFLTVVFGIWQLWRSWRSINQLQASEEDVWLGHVLLLSGIALLPFSFGLAWLMPLACAVILMGIACSSWGVRFFQQYWISCGLIMLGLIPNPGVIAHHLLAALMPPLILESITAHMAGWVLWAMRQPVQIHGPVIALATSSVEVNWGCTPFNLSTAVALAGLLAGLFMRLNWRRTSLMMTIGVAICVILNTPRIAFLAIAKAYWGDWWFDFWHAGWGAQIFSMTVFTIYYYVVMAMIKVPKVEK
jgi:exosortase/archaeosortase family protein